MRNTKPTNRLRTYLRTMRRGRGLTEWQCAEHMGIATSVYCRLERGSIQPDMSLSTMERIAGLFQITPEEVMHMEQEYLRGGA